MASQGAIQHEDTKELSALAGYNVRRAGVIGLITDAQVVAATSAEDLEVIVEAGLPGTIHSEHEVDQIMADRALKFGDAIGDFTNDRIAAATTVQGVSELTTAADESDLAHHGPPIIG